MPVIAASSLATVDGNNKRNWTSTYKAISLRQSHLEKDLSGWLAKLTTSQLPVRKNGSQQATLLLDLVESDQKHLQDDSRQMLAELELIKKLLRSAKQLQHYRTQSSQQPDARYLSELERLLHSLEDRIAAMKLSNRQSLLELTQKERRLESELNDFEQRIADWERRSNNIIDQQQQSKHHQSGPEVDRLSERMKSLSTDRRVEEYDLYLSRRGGRTGGWTDEDHTAFTKLRAKYRAKGGDDFINICTAQLGMSRADIKEHECWFVELLRLQERRREAIAEWRDAKAGRITGDNNTMIIESTVNQQQSVEDEEAVKNALVDSSPSKEPTAAEKARLAAKERVRQWRQSILERQQQEEAEKQHQQQLQQQEERDRFKAHQEQLKAKVEEHRRQRQLSSRSSCSSADNYTEQETRRCHQRSQSMRELKQRQQEEIERVRRRRMQSVNQKTAEESAKSERMERIKAPVIKMVSMALDRKPQNQYLEPTQSKILDADPVETNISKIRRFFTPGNGIMHTRVLPHRRIPDWRRGV